MVISCPDAADSDAPLRLPPCSALLALAHAAPAPTAALVPAAFKIPSPPRRSNIHALLNDVPESPPWSDRVQYRPRSISPTPSLSVGSLSASPSPQPSPNWSLRSLPTLPSRSTSPVAVRRGTPHPYARAPPTLSDDVSSTPTALDDEWRAHVTGSDLHTRCTWALPGGGECGFESRKHATKRHVETTHLLIKRWECRECGKDFTQKASLLRHHSLHTGAMPFQCQYAGCERTFNDRSRRHKHMIDVHGHQPKPHQRRNARKP